MSDELSVRVDRPQLVTVPPNGFLTFTLPELMAKRFPPPRWIIPDILSEGTTILGGKAKKGKSWFALGVGLAAAYGGVALGCLPVERNAVLYMALEDSEELLQDRCRQLIGDESPPPNFHYATFAPTLDMDLLPVLESWLDEHAETRFVIIDTLKRVRPARTGRNAYDEDYEALAPIADLSHRRRLSILVLHHLRKEPSEDDPFDELSGSMGLQAAPDSLMVMRGVRGQADAVLHITGRRIKEEKQLALTFSKEDGIWNLEGDAQEVLMGRERQDILDVLSDAGEALPPRDIAALTGKNPATVRVLLHKMVKAGQIAAPRGSLYFHTPVNGVNSVNGPSEASTGPTGTVYGVYGVYGGNDHARVDTQEELF